MAILTEPSKSARSSLKLIIFGALLVVWAACWWLYLRNTDADVLLYVCAAVFGSGVVLLLIGLTVGQIGRSAREAELPPAEVTQDAVRVETEAAKAGAPLGPKLPRTPPVSGPPTLPRPV
jgi:hypothetical protein